MSHILDDYEDEEDIGGDAWGSDPQGLLRNSKELLKEDIDNKIAEFLASGGQIVDCGAPKEHTTANRFNNRLTNSFDYDRDSLFTRNEHDAKFADRVYSNDSKAINKIRSLLPKSLDKREMCQALGVGGRSISLYKFMRLIRMYFRDDPLAQHYFIDYVEAVKEKQEHDDKLILNHVREAFKIGYNMKDTWSYVADVLGINERQVRCVTNRNKVTCPNAFKRTAVYVKGSAPKICQQAKEEDLQGPTQEV